MEVEGEDAAEALVREALEELRLQAVHLDLYFSGLGPPESGPGLQRVLSAAQISTSLIALDLSVNPLGPSGVAAVGDFLARTPRLRSLTLFRCGAGPEGAAALADGLAANVSLLDLHLAANEAGVRGGRALARAVALHPKLKRLNLQGNALCAAVKEIGDALARSPALTELNISENAMDQAGALALARALGESTRLKKLDLRNDALAFDCEAALFAGLARSPSIERLQTTRFDLAYRLLRRAVLRALALGQPPQGLGKRLLTQLQHDHVAHESCLRAWGRAYREGRALCSLPRCVASPLTSERRLAEFFGLVDGLGSPRPF